MRTISNDIYPMPLFVRLEVRDIPSSRNWYCQTLGFLDLYSLDGPSGVLLMTHLRWAKYADLMLVPRASEFIKPGDGVHIYITLEKGEVDTIANRAGDRVLEGPVNRPWNTREVVVSDPDGYRLIFAEGPVNASSSFDKVMKRAGEAIH